METQNDAAATSVQSVVLSSVGFRREWAMPNAETFSVPVIGDFVQKYLRESASSIDPFARNKQWATYTNDINANTKATSHKEAREFLRELVDRQVKADLILFDPPYSPPAKSPSVTRKLESNPR